MVEKYRLGSRLCNNPVFSSNRVDVLISDAVSRAFDCAGLRMQSGSVFFYAATLSNQWGLLVSAFLATMASADFLPARTNKISPGKVHELSARAIGLYLSCHSVTVGLRGS